MPISSDDDDFIPAEIFGPAPPAEEEADGFTFWHASTPRPGPGGPGDGGARSVPAAAATAPAPAFADDESPELSVPPPDPVPGAAPPPVAPRHERRRPAGREAPALLRLDRLLRHASERGASRLYLACGTPPSIRIGAEIEPIGGAPAPTAIEIETIALTFSTAGGTVVRPGVGRVRCTTFDDHRGPGAVFHLTARAADAEPVRVPADIQSLLAEPGGLVVIAGPRSSGKRTMLGALLDLMSRSRRAHVISVERNLESVSAEADAALISRRQVHGGFADAVAAARAALQEDPDVLVLQEAGGEPGMTAAIEAAASGVLVIAGFTVAAPSTALEQILNLYPPERKADVQHLLSQHLRAVIGQLLLPRIGGGRIAAREVIFNTPALAAALRHGTSERLRAAIEGGRAHGNVPLTDVLVELVTGGLVSAAEAYRHAPDPAGFLEGLADAGYKTSFA